MPHHSSRKRRRESTPPEMTSKKKDKLTKSIEIIDSETSTSDIDETTQSNMEDSDPEPKNPRDRQRSRRSSSPKSKRVSVHPTRRTQREYSPEDVESGDRSQPRKKRQKTSKSEVIKPREKAGKASSRTTKHREDTPAESEDDSDESQDESEESLPKERERNVDRGKATKLRGKAKKPKSALTAGKDTIKFNNRWTQRDEEELNSTWTREDDVVLENTDAAEIALWKKCRKIFGKIPPEAIPKEIEIDTTGQKPIPDSSSRKARQYANTNWAHNICFNLGQLICCPIFKDRLYYLQYVLRLAIYHRVGQPKYKKPSKSQIRVASSKEMQETHNTALEYYNQRATVPADSEIFLETMNKMFGGELPKHHYFLKLFHVKIKPSKEREGLVISDVLSIIKAWDAYSKTDASLSTVQQYATAWNKEKNNVHKGPVAGKGPGSEQDHSPHILYLKKRWILSQRREIIIAERPQEDTDDSTDEETPSPRPRKIAKLKKKRIIYRKSVDTSGEESDNSQSPEIPGSPILANFPVASSQKQTRQMSISLGSGGNAASPIEGSTDNEEGPHGFLRQYADQFRNMGPPTNHFAAPPQPHICRKPKAQPSTEVGLGADWEVVEVAVVLAA